VVLPTRWTSPTGTKSVAEPPSPRQSVGVATITWDRELAQAYDETYAAMFEPSVLDPVLDMLADLAGGAEVSRQPIYGPDAAVQAQQIEADHFERAECFA